MEGVRQPECASGVVLGRELGVYATTRNLPTLTAIVTAHDDVPWAIIENLMDQTIQPTQVVTAVSGWPTDRGWPDPAYEIHLNMDDYGYDKRNKLLPRATGDYVGFFCHDDRYDLDFVESMLTAAVEGNADIVYCGWDEPNKAMVGGFRTMADCQFKAFDSTLGNFIVRTSLMKQIGGFPIGAAGDLITSAAVVKVGSGLPVNTELTGKGWLDGLAIIMLKELTDRIVKVDRVLFHHNQPYWKEIRPSVWGVKQ